MYENTNRNTIILVRHGESTFNKDGLIQGQTNDSVLTEAGEAQARAVGEWLRDVPISTCIASPLKRVMQSTSIIASSISKQSCDIQYDDRLIEIDFGSWVGRNRREVKDQYSDAYNDWRNRPFEFSLNGRYPVRELYQRLDSISSKLKDPKKQAGTILIVGHRGTVSGLVIQLLGLPKSHHHFLQVDRGSVTVVRERRRTRNSIDYELVCANERPTAHAPHPVDFITEERTKSYGEIFLVRHGQTSSNIVRKYQGGKDTRLSDEGRANVRNLAKSFIPPYPSRVFSSPLARAQESAEILATEFGVKTISKRKDLHEFLYGVWEGMTEEDVQKYRKSEYSQWKAAPVDTEIPQAEHINDAYNRCRDVWEFFENDIKFWGGSIISVAHDIVNRLLICNALDLPASYVWKFKQTNASVSVLAIKKTHDGRLRMLNHSPYPLSQRLRDEWL